MPGFGLGKRMTMKRGFFTIFLLAASAFVAPLVATQAHADVIFQSNADDPSLMLPVVTLQDVSHSASCQSPASALELMRRAAYDNASSAGKTSSVNVYLYSELQDSSTEACPADSFSSAANIKMNSYSALMPPVTADCDSVMTASVDPEAMPPVPIVVNRNVETFINYFQNRGRKYFEKWMDRSVNYMSMLRGILREEGIPEDISYIAFIESGLNPTARSKSNAVGMWQFIKGTAKIYGLRVDGWIDERMDPEKATYAAARYFKTLYGQFGSWYLAAAGYNAGEGKVQRAVKKHNTEDFWELASYRRSFKRETKEYVPKYLAALVISKDPKAYGFESVGALATLEYEKVKVSQATDLRVIAEAAGSDVEEIRRLNPELLRSYTPPNYPDYEIKIPFGASQMFAENMAKNVNSTRMSFLTHKVRRGETLMKLAKKYGSTIDQLVYVNNLKSTKYVKPGTTLMVPVTTAKGKKGGKELAEAFYVDTYQG